MLLFEPDKPLEAVASMSKNGWKGQSEAACGSRPQFPFAFVSWDHPAAVSPRVRFGQAHDRLRFDAGARAIPPG